MLNLYEISALKKKNLYEMFVKVIFNFEIIELVCFLSFFCFRKFSLHACMYKKYILI